MSNDWDEFDAPVTGIDWLMCGVVAASIAMVALTAIGAVTVFHWIFGTGA